MRICEKGRSMIEMLGVLAIVGVLSVGGIAGYSKAMAKYKMNTLLSQVSELTMNIRSLYIHQGNYEGMSERVVIDAGVIPNGIVVNGSSKLVHILNGNILFFESQAEDGTPKAFEMYVTGLTNLTCVSFATMDWGQDPASGFQAMFVGTGEITDPQMYDIVSAGDTDPDNGIYTTGVHDFALPLGVKEASDQCACSNNECVVGLKYFL